MSRPIALCLTAALLALAAFSAAGQGEITPTPAPSKTPTAAAATVETPAAASSSGQMEPLTQADLSIITGNVQRPNGIAWYNGFLYTACTGDGTIYEISDTTGQTRTYIYGIRNAQTLYVEQDASENLVLWVPDYQANALNRVTRSGVQTVVRNLQGPWGIAFVDDQYFLLTNLLGNTINRVSRDGDNEVMLEGLSSPMGLVHNGQTVYVANYGSTRRSIEWYALDDMLGGVADTADGNHVLVSGLQNTTGLQLGSDGRLYFSYSLGNRGLVGRVDPQVCLDNGGCTNDQVEIVLYSDLTVPLAGFTITPDMRMFLHTMFVPDIYWAQIPE